MINYNLIAAVGTITISQKLFLSLRHNICLDLLIMLNDFFYLIHAINKFSCLPEIIHIALNIY